MVHILQVHPSVEMHDSMIALLLSWGGKLHGHLGCYLQMTKEESYSAERVELRTLPTIRRGTSAGANSDHFSCYMCRFMTQLAVTILSAAGRPQAIQLTCGAMPLYNMSPTAAC